MNKKILFLIDSLQIGGTETSLLAICKGLKIFQPVVVVLFQKNEMKSAFKESGIDVIFLGCNRTYNFHTLAKRVLPLAKEIDPSLIHSSLFYSDMTLRFLNFNIPKVSSLVSNTYSSRRISVLPFSIKLKIRALQVLDRISANRIDLFISNSETIRKCYIKQVGISGNKIQTIYRGRDIRLFSPLQILTSNYEKSDFRFLIVGRLIASKGHRELIQAFSHILSEFPKAQLQIAGDGPERHKLEIIAEELGVVSNVYFLGSRHDIPYLLTKADFFVFPTYYEGLPGSLIEAMMSKIPIICSDIPENKECLDESMCLFHKVGDQEDLLVQMKKGLTLKDWEQRTQKAFDYAVAHFEIDEIAKRYEEVYLKLLN